MSAYDRKREDMRARSAAESAAGRDIAPLPEIVDPERRAAAEPSLRLFCESYLPASFPLAWSPDHLVMLERTEEAVLRGGTFAVAMPRGSGKSTSAEAACIWAALCGHRDFIALIGATELHAEEMLESIKTELETNDLLLEDFPEAIYPIRKLEGISHRANGQVFRGVRTRIGWTAKEVILPTIEGSKASGAIIRIAGITGRIRGMKFKRPDGKAVRPSLVVIDDPQTNESAESPSQCAARERTLAGAILGLAGPKRKIAGIMPCTVIRPGDMADRILDRNLHPEWNGQRTRMVRSWSKNEKLWDQYLSLRAECMRNGEGVDPANAFYIEHRKEMDEGAEVYWPERFKDGEVSAIQSAYNLRADMGDAAFSAECQNEPITDNTQTAGAIVAAAVAERLNGLPQFQVPDSHDVATAFIDVQDGTLWWTLCSWSSALSGAVHGYGVFPEQHRDYVTARDCKINFYQSAPGADFDTALKRALAALTDKIMSLQLSRADGEAVTISRVLIDANWGKSTDAVRDFCRTSPHRAILMPSNGRGIGASSLPMERWNINKKNREQRGFHWMTSVHDGVRHAVTDINYWKSRAAAGLICSTSDTGAITLWGTSKKTHRMFADHMASEYAVPVEGRGRKLDEWRMRPGETENHCWDGVVGCMAAASICGAGAQPKNDKPERRMVSLRQAAAARSHGDQTRQQPAEPHREEAQASTSGGQSPPCQRGPISFSEIQRTRRR